jgi:uncharacterized protein (TIGR03437 family)
VEETVIVSRFAWFCACVALVSSGSLHAQTTTPPLIAKPDHLFFRQNGSKPPASQTVTVSVRKGTLGTVSASASGGSWLSATPSGTTITVSVDTTGLASGKYTGSVGVSASGFASATVNVDLTIAGANVASTPETLNMQVTVGGDPTAVPRVVEIFNRSGAAFNWSASADQPWIVMNPSSGSGKSGMAVSVNPASITTAGSYTGHITVTDTTNSTKDTVTVNLTANAPKPPDFELGPYLYQPGQIFWTVDNNTATPGPRIFYGRNVGGNGPKGSGPLQFTLTETVDSPAGGNWLSISPTTNTTPGKTTATANPAGLEPGSYIATVNGVAQEPTGVTGGNLTSTLQAHLTVLSNPNIFVDRNFVAFVASTLQNPPVPTPASTTVNFVTKSTTGYPFTSTVTTGSGGNWISVSPSSGTAASGGSVSISIVPSVIASLTPGYYSGQVQLNFSGGAPVSDHTITVGLRIEGSSTSEPLLDVAPGGQVFVATAGGANPASQNVSVRAEGTAATGLTYTVTTAVSTPSGGSWLSAGSSGGTALPTSSTVPISVNIAGLSAGRYSGTVSFNPDPTSNAPNPVVNVILIVNPAPSNSTPPSSDPSRLKAMVAAPSTFAAGPLVATFVNPADNFVTSTESALVVGVYLTDSSGAPVPGGSVTVSSSNGEPDITLTDLGNGNYSGVFQPQVSGTLTLSVAAEAVDGSGDNNSASTSAVAGDVESATNVALPVYTDGAVSAATFAPQPAPLTPGQIISLFGFNMLTASGQASGLPLPANLGGTSVTIGGMPAPLFATYPASTPGANDQINLQMPYELNGQPSADIVVTTNGVSGVPQTVPLGVAPAFFTQNSSGIGDGSFVHSDGITLITPANPAAPGETIVLYGTGLGALQTALPSGTAATAADNVAAPVAVTIGGISATVAYAGAAPFSVGENQLDVVVPQGLTPGENVVIVSINGTPGTGQATVAVK